MEISNRQDTEGNWLANDQVIPAGVTISVIKSDGNMDLKIGDGNRKFSELPYVTEASYLVRNDQGKIEIETFSQYGVKNKILAKSILFDTKDAYGERIILLLPISEENISNSRLIEGSIVIGKNGSNIFDKINIMAQSVYDETIAMIDMNGKQTNHSLVTCMYNGIKWLALKLHYAANPYQFGLFWGFGYSDLQNENILRCICYKNYETGITTNQEINNSIQDYIKNGEHKKFDNEIFCKDILLREDNLYDLGSASSRVKEIFAGNGTINTSDAREKTEISTLSEAEISAAKQLLNEIGTYKWLTSIEKKANEARIHIGLTVQKAIEVLESNGLNAMQYGLICYDEWEAETIEHEATEEKEAWTEVLIPSGNRYGFRYDQLNQFLIAGLNAKLEEALS